MSCEYLFWNGVGCGARKRLGKISEQGQLRDFASSRRASLNGLARLSNCASPCRPVLALSQSFVARERAARAQTGHLWHAV